MSKHPSEVREDQSDCCSGERSVGAVVLGGSFPAAGSSGWQAAMVLDRQDWTLIRSLDWFLAHSLDLSSLRTQDWSLVHIQGEVPVAVD